jgi:hypothetical protein
MLEHIGWPNQPVFICIIMLVSRAGEAEAPLQSIDIVVCVDE